ncbi:MAG: AAA family ATPase [Clostridia bacterium]|nr:AAA family ATPase [Clostridia bacterium]
MGQYINPGSGLFEISAHDNHYVDKSMLLAFTNSRIGTDRRFICVSRPRRSGKSVAAGMLNAYYSSGCDSRDIFSGLKIASDPSYEEHLNGHIVIYLNMIRYCMTGTTVLSMIRKIERQLKAELLYEYPYADSYTDHLTGMLLEVSGREKKTFIIVVDEWDCVLRDDRPEHEKEAYLAFLNRLFTVTGELVSLVYMTGILPVKKSDGRYMALGRFDNISMVDASPAERFTGFTEGEVKALCSRFGKPFDDIRAWYDGYTVNGVTIYNPLSVVVAVEEGAGPVWVSTASVDSLVDYIGSGIEGVEDAVQSLLAGKPVPVSITETGYDLTALTTKDQVLTALVHLGYLTYDRGSVRIPNYEIRQNYITCLEIMAETNRSKAKMDG